MRCADFGPTPGNRPELVDQRLNRTFVERQRVASAQQSAEVAETERSEVERPEVGRDRAELLLLQHLRLAGRLRARPQRRDLRAFRRRRDRRRCGSIAIDSNAPSPLTVAFTTPPPTVASMTSLANASCAACMSACIFWICPKMPMGLSLVIVVSDQSRECSSTTCAPSPSTRRAAGSGGGASGASARSSRSMCSRSSSRRRSGHFGRVVGRRTATGRSASAASKSCAAHHELRLGAEARRERSLDRGRFAAEPRLDRVERACAARRTRSHPVSMPIGCASWIVARTGGFSASSAPGHASITSSSSGTTTRRLGRSDGRRGRLGRRRRQPRRRGVGFAARARREHRTARVGSRSGAGAGFGAVGGATGDAVDARSRHRPASDLLLEPLDSIEQRLLARPRLTARESYDRDFEDEPRVGDRLPANVDDGLAQHLDAAHQRDVAHALRELGELLRLRRPDRRTGTRAPALAQRKASRNVRRRSSATRRGSWPATIISCTPASTPATSSPAAASSTATRCSNGTPPNAASTSAPSSAPPPIASAWSSSRQRIARRAPGTARDEIEDLVVGLDAFAGEDVGKQADQLVVREQRRTRSAGCATGWSAAPSADRWWRARTRRARAALRASSAACSMPPPRACAPRR